MPTSTAMTTAAAAHAALARAGRRAPSRRIEHALALGLRVAGFRARRVTTSAGRVHVLDAKGEGTLPTIVLLHGLGSSAAEYAPLLFRLRRAARRVLAPDLLGHGLSDAPDDMDSAAIRAALLEALDAVVDEPVIAFGNSLGGLAAIRWALARPSHVRSLVLASPGGAPSTPAELEALRAAFQMRNHREALAFADRLLARRTWIRPIIAWGARRKFAHPATARILDEMRADDLLAPSHLAALAAPTLLLWGREERILPPSHLAFFRAHLPNAVIEEPAGFGHSPFLDAPAEVAARIIAFASGAGEQDDAPAEAASADEALRPIRVGQR